MTRDIGPHAKAFRVEYRMRGHWLYAHLVAASPEDALERARRRFHQAGGWRVDGLPAVEAKRRTRKGKTA